MLPALTLTLMFSATPAPAMENLEAEEKKWHDDRIERLQSEDGWLTLVGLHWLDEGENPAGSDPKAKVHLVASAPAQLGTFIRRGKSVEFKPADGVKVQVGGKPFTGGALK